MGVSGTLLLSALLAHGFSTTELQKTFASVVPQGYQIECQDVYEQGIHGVRVLLQSHAAVITHAYDEWIVAIRELSLAESIQAKALACLACLAEAKVALTGQGQHEIFLSAEVIFEVLGVVTGLAALGIEQLYASPLPLGSGVVQTAHGIQMVPAPVTLEILRHVPAIWQASPLAGAIVTPVGAAILAVYAHFELPILTIEQVGYGFAVDSGPLRICLGPAQQMRDGQSAARMADIDWVTVIESHLDTMTGELLGGLMERLFEAGALDVTYTPIQMKKNRPASLITVIAPLALGETLALLLLRETTTLGIRTQQVQRLKAQREQIELATSLGPMLVKVKRLGTQIISAAPEYEECRRIAQERNMPLMDVYEVARRAIQIAII